MYVQQRGWLQLIVDPFSEELSCPREFVGNQLGQETPNVITVLRTQQVLLGHPWAKNELQTAL